MTFLSVLLFGLLPAHAQLNYNRALQNAQQKSQDAADTQKQTQQHVNTATSPTAQAMGTLVSITGDLVLIDQVTKVNGQSVTFHNKFYLQKTTHYAANWKPTQKAKVKIVFQTGTDGRRMIDDIGP